MHVATALLLSYTSALTSLFEFQCLWKLWSWKRDKLLSGLIFFFKLWNCHALWLLKLKNNMVFVISSITLPLFKTKLASEFKFPLLSYSILYDYREWHSQGISIHYLLPKNNKNLFWDQYVVKISFCISKESISYLGKEWRAANWDLPTVFSSLCETAAMSPHHLYVTGAPVERRLSAKGAGSRQGRSEVSHEMAWGLCGALGVSHRLWGAEY